jgi:Bacteriocin-protection, YdeI or OmpD-Associated/Domain of unknown function (DU1801)
VAKEDIKDLQKFLEPYPPASREITLAIRDWVWDLYPRCNELIYDNYNFLAFGWAPNDRMGDIFCNVAVGTRGVIFGFNWGVKLNDPKGLLRGGGNQFRSTRVPDLDEFPREDVENLIHQAYQNAIAGLGGRSAEPTGKTIVKSISAVKRRPGMPKRAAPERRKKHPIPDFVLNALEGSKLFDAFESRPPYQQNDYIGWIIEAKQLATQQRRLVQMLDEPRQGNRYMKMPYKPKGK